MRKKDQNPITREDLQKELFIVKEDLQKELFIVKEDLQKELFIVKEDLDAKIDRKIDELRDEQKQYHNEVMQGIDRLTYRFKTLDEEHVAYIDWRDKTDHTLKVHDKDILRLKTSIHVV